MGTEIITVMRGTIDDDETGIPLATLCRACRIPVETVASLVAEGILEPEGARRGRWRFPVDSIRRTRRAIRLQRDLELNLAGVAVALDLLDRLESLRTRLRRIESRRYRGQLRQRTD